MALPLCPFCTSRVPWNACTCQYAIMAGRYGMREARLRFAAHGEPQPNPKRAAVVDPEPKPSEAADGEPAVDLAGSSSETKARQSVPAAAQHGVDAPGVDGSSAAKPKFDRTAYQREYMRNRRKAART